MKWAAAVIASVQRAARCARVDPRPGTRPSAARRRTRCARCRPAAEEPRVSDGPTRTARLRDRRLWPDSTQRPVALAVPAAAPITTAASLPADVRYEIRSGAATRSGCSGRPRAEASRSSHDDRAQQRKTRVARRTSAAAGGRVGRKVEAERGRPAALERPHARRGERGAAAAGAAGRPDRRRGRPTRDHAEAVDAGAVRAEHGHRQLAAAGGERDGEVAVLAREHDGARGRRRQASRPARRARGGATGARSRPCRARARSAPPTAATTPASRTQLGAVALRAGRRGRRAEEPPPVPDRRGRAPARAARSSRRGLARSPCSRAARRPRARTAPGRGRSRRAPRRPRPRAPRSGRRPPPSVRAGSVSDERGQPAGPDARRPDVEHVGGRRERARRAGVERVARERRHGHERERRVATRAGAAGAATREHEPRRAREHRRLAR